MDEIRVVRGAPTEEELAAVVAVLLSREPVATPAKPPMSRWARSARPRVVARGPGAWRASALPR